MLKIVAVCLLVPLVVGCAALSQSRRAGVVSVPDVSVNKTSEPPGMELRRSLPPPKPVMAQKKPRSGLIAGKTDFRGLLKAPYVRLSIEKRDDAAKKFFFYIGNKGNQSVVPWGEEKMVEPGYFTLQLEPGPYKVTRIAIPVGSTLAEESLELDFEVLPGRVVYVGTLDVEGTKEKVKFGGVPLLRPGFAYRLAIKDEIEEATASLHDLLPRDLGVMEKKLFTVVALDDGGIPPAESLIPGVQRK